MNERIFISYKRVDKERVFAIKNGIEQATGEKCWIDLDGIESNAQFVAKIVGAIDACEIFLFMRSKEHNKITNLETDWTIREVNYALEEHKNIVIVNLDNTPMPKWFKFMFPNKQEIEATDPAKLTRLNNDLCEWLGITPRTIPQPAQVEIPIQPTPSQPTVIQTPADIEKNKRETLPDGEFQVGELKYRASEDSNGVTVCGRPIKKRTAEIHIPSQIKYGKDTYDVTSIGDEAFRGRKTITSITIPNSVTSIGRDAFLGCSKLKSIVVESGNTIYDSRENCNAIIETATNTLITGCQNTIIPNSVTSIGKCAFWNCFSLTSITIPNSVTSIGWEAFNNCSSLTSITIPNSVTFIGGFAFAGCSSLTSITIPNSVTWIGSGAFFYCRSLTSITIPNSVTGIGDEAFEDCSSLTSITIPNSVTSIGWHAFSNCKSLTTFNYAGTKEDWMKIKKDERWNTYSNIKIIRCTDGR